MTGVQAIDDQRGAARTDGPRPTFTRFTEQFSDDQLAIVWKFSGLGFDPETQQVAPYPGREMFVKFLRPVPGSWRDILRRAVRTMGNRRDLAALRALLLAVLSGRVVPAPRPLTAPARRALTPQERCHRFTQLHVCDDAMGAAK